jgi:predicted dithiol-disulfide oxidoreductase (DUF899 family)
MEVAVDTHKIVSREEWLAARKSLLEEEKRFTRERDALSEKRRGLPWVRVDKAYVFEGADGKRTLADLFEGRSQLIVYHFMYAPDWEAGCKSCSFWADNFNGIVGHLAQRDVTLVAISVAPYPQLAAFEKRMGWTFTWLSSAGSDFNRDFGVSFTEEERADGGAPYNFGTGRFGGPEAPGISVFYKDESGDIFHTYSCYSRGLDMLNGAYHYLDLVPKGRDEGALSYSMAWVRLHDEYGSAAETK